MNGIALGTNIASALDAAAHAETLEAAAAAGDTLNGLIGRLQDDQAEGGSLSPEVAAALPQLRSALQQVTRLRLSEREFVDASAEELIEELVQKDALTLFERKYRGRYFRWKVKFAGKGARGRFTAHAGTHVEVACALDPSVPESTLALLEQWQVVTIEGRCTGVEAFGKARDPRRAKVVFDSCIVE
jgi:hypothetical protein